MIDDIRSYSAQVRQRGQLTIPRKLRESLRIEDGDTLTFMPMGETLVLVPRRLRAPELIDRLATMLEDSDQSLADLLIELPRIREALYNERYAAGQGE